MLLLHQLESYKFLNSYVNFAFLIMGINARFCLIILLGAFYMQGSYIYYNFFYENNFFVVYI